MKSSLSLIVVAAIRGRGKMVRIFTRRVGIGFLCISSVLSLIGCSGLVRRDAPPLSYRDAVPAGFSEDVMYVDDRGQGAEARSTPVLWDMHPAIADAPINVLALSGGGSGVAFGAGAIVGWTRAGTRPEFQIVTGVSAGALLAAYAFLGPSWDATISQAFSGAGTQHLFQARWIGALVGASVYRGEPLAKLVDQCVTDRLLRAVAAESAKGRLLLVATTDLDRGRTVIWNLGRIAAVGGEPARRLFRDLLVASASIPGVFPPVLIRVQRSGVEFDEMHVDGGTTAPLFIAPGFAAVTPGRDSPLRGSNVYVIVNGRLHGQASTTRVRTVSIVRRGVDAALDSRSRAAVEAAVSLSNQIGMTLQVTEIPDDYPYTGSLDVRPSNMAALFDFGFRCASRQELWGSAAQALAQPSLTSPTDQPSTPAVCPASAVDRHYSEANSSLIVASHAGVATSHANPSGSYAGR
jgi:predicted acylesterase/phospholipase RssA